GVERLPGGAGGQGAGGAVGVVVRVGTVAGGEGGDEGEDGEEGEDARDTHGGSDGVGKEERWRCADAAAEGRSPPVNSHNGRLLHGLTKRRSERLAARRAPLKGDAIFLAPPP